MKKIFYFIASAIVALGAVACQNDINEGVTPESEGFSINVTIADQTRVALGDLDEDTKQRKLTFTEGDVLVVREDSQRGTNYLFTYTKNEGDVYTFTCEQEGVSKLVGTNPYIFYQGGLHEQADDLTIYGTICNTAAEDISGIGMYASPYEFDQTGKFGEEGYTVILRTCPLLKFTANESVTFSCYDEDDNIEGYLFFTADGWASEYTTKNTGEIYLPIMHSNSEEYKVTVTTESGFNKSFTKVFELGKIYNLGTIEAAAPAPVEKTAATITFNNTSKRTSFSTTQQVWEENNIVVTNDKASSTTNVADYFNPVRFYKSSKVTIEAPGNITKIVFDCPTNDNNKYVLTTASVPNATINNGIVTVVPSESSKTYTFSLAAQGRANSITVTYLSNGEGGETPEPEMPTLATPENLTYVVDEDNIISVTWDEVENAEAYKLTINGETTEVTYTDLDIDGDWNTTYEISVVAVAEGYNDSEAATVTVKIGSDPDAEGPATITVEEFLNLKDTATEYILTGEITRVVNTQYGNFDITDETGTLYIYGLLTPDGVAQKQWAAADLHLGDIITLKVAYSVYNNAPQGKNATYISSINFIQRNLAFSKSMVTLTEGDTFEAPTLSGTKIDDVTYASDNTEVATVEATTGKVTIVGVGTAKISASAPKTETHAAGSASYTITVNEKGTTVVEGGRDDFSTLSANTSYNTYTSKAGWKGVNCAVMSGGTNDTAPSCKSMLGTDSSVKALVINGKTSAKGTITSPTIKTGCGKLSLKYGSPYSEGKNPNFKVEIKQGSSVVKTFEVNGEGYTKYKAYTWEQDVNVAGDFQIVITNLSPSNSSSNKDRTAIWDVVWTGYAN